MEAVKHFPIARQNIIGRQAEDEGIAVLIADWTSAAEKDEFEPGLSTLKMSATVMIH